MLDTQGILIEIVVPLVLSALLLSSWARVPARCAGVCLIAALSVMAVGVFLRPAGVGVEWNQLVQFSVLPPACVFLVAQLGVLDRIPLLMLLVGPAAYWFGIVVTIVIAVGLLGVPLS